MSGAWAGVVRAGAPARDQMDPTWPPVLVALVVAVLIGAVIVVAVLFHRFRAAARGDRPANGGPHR